MSWSCNRTQFMTPNFFRIISSISIIDFKSFGHILGDLPVSKDFRLAQMTGLLRSSTIDTFLIIKLHN